MGVLTRGDTRRRWILLATAALAALVFLAVGVLPASAGAGGPSDLGVRPSEEDLGGQSSDCPAVGSLADYELRIENPQDGVTYNGVGDSSFTVSLVDDEILGVTASGAVFYDIVIKGGANSTHFDYEASVYGPQASDTGLHAPTKRGNRLFSVSHVSICYEVAATCGDELTRRESVWDANVEIFFDGNDETPCDDKYATLFVTDDVLNLPFFGSGTAAAFAKLTKSFTSPNDFVPLEYSLGPNDPWMEVPWCALRGKTGADGNQFDPYLDDDTMYPSLDGVADPVCQVFRAENIEGVQVNVLLIQDDPRFR